MTKPQMQEQPFHVKAYINEFRMLKHELNLFMNSVSTWFSTHPEMALCNPPIIHSVKARLKSEDHLKEKLKRKYAKTGLIEFAPAQLSKVVTDLAGVRVMHIHQKQCESIHKLLMEKDRGWRLVPS